MRNSLLTGALLVAACALVISAITLSWMEIQEYKHGVERVDVTMPDDGGRREGPEEPEDATGAEAADLVSYAPADAFAMAVIDAGRLVKSNAWDATPQLKSMAKSQSKSIEFGAIDRVVFFLSPNPSGPDAEPLGTGVMSINISPDKFKSAMKEEATSTESVNGKTAYVGDGYYGVLMEDKVLMGSTRDALKSIMDRYESGAGGAPSELTNALDRYSASSISFAAIVPGDLREKALQSTPEEGSKFMQDVDAVSGGLHLEEETIRVDTDVKFSVAESARSAADMAKEKMDGIQEKVSSMMEKMEQAGEGNQQQKEAMDAVTRVLNSIQIFADGNRMKAGANIRLEDVGKAVAFPMMQMMGSMAEGMGAKDTASHQPDAKPSEEPESRRGGTSGEDTSQETEGPAQPTEPLPALGEEKVANIITENTQYKDVNVLTADVEPDTIGKFFPRWQLVSVMVGTGRGGKTVARIILDKEAEAVTFMGSTKRLPAPDMKKRMLQKTIKANGAKDIHDLLSAYLLVASPQLTVKKVERLNDREFLVNIGKKEQQSKQSFRVTLNEDGVVKDWKYQRE